MGRWRFRCSLLLGCGRVYVAVLGVSSVVTLMKRGDSFCSALISAPSPIHAWVLFFAPFVCFDRGCCTRVDFTVSGIPATAFFQKLGVNSVLLLLRCRHYFVQWIFPASAKPFKKRILMFHFLEIFPFLPTLRNFPLSS